MTASRAALLAAWGAAVVWFSHPSIFVLAASGSSAWPGGRRRGTGDGPASGWSSGLAWVGSFAGVHAVATHQLGGSDQMWRFWDFAFPPMPPSLRLGRHLGLPTTRDTTSSIPLNFDSPVRRQALDAPGDRPGAWAAVARLWKVDRRRLALLMLPVASSWRRLACGSIRSTAGWCCSSPPSPLLAIAAGLDRVREHRGRTVLYCGPGDDGARRPGVGRMRSGVRAGQEPQQLRRPPPLRPQSVPIPVLIGVMAVVRNVVVLLKRSWPANAAPATCPCTYHPEGSLKVRSTPR